MIAFYQGITRTKMFKGNKDIYVCDSETYYLMK